jgi:exodeoxyribonuclease V alpha subunit
MEAKTIHRLLSYHPENGFRYNYDEPLRTDVVIVDEASMIDTMLMYHLVDAIPLGAKLIIIGDVDQLPSVGAGNVLHDLIKSETIPLVRLTKIHRQAEGSLIIKNAHNVINGKPLEINNQVGSDFYFIERNTDEEALGEVVTLTQQRLFKYFGSQLVQVLTPLRKNTVLGADSLNKYLQQALNPDALLKCEYNGTEFRDGDPVMQIKNDYNLMRFNGETGVVSYAADYGKRDKSLKIIFEDEKSPTFYENSDIRNLSLNYACTIHKSQGSEYDIVIIPLMPSAGIMQQRNLLYTAITRAKKVCILIGSKNSIRAAIQNWHTKPRWTQLSELLSNS